MRFDAKRGDLDDIVSWVARSLPARPPMQVLLGIKIDVLPDGRVDFSSFDYEQSAKGALSVEEGSQAGSVLVPGKLLSDIVKAMPQDVVHFDLDGTRVVLKCGQARFTVPTLPVEDYPALPDTPQPIGTVGSDVLADTVRRVAVAAGKDDTLPVLTGVRAEVRPDDATITLVATDRYRLTRQSMAFEPAPGIEPMDLLIPSRALAGFAAAMGTDAVITLGADSTKANGLLSVANDRRTATTRLLDGEYPKYGALLPESSPATATASVASLAEAVKRVALVAARNSPCQLSFSDGKVVVEAGGGDDAQAREEVGLTYTGDPIAIAFSFQYLLDGLAAVGGSEVKINLTSATRPATLTPGDGEGDFVYLLMPVRLKQ